MRRNEPASRATWAARTSRTVEGNDRTYDAAWNGNVEAQNATDDEMT